MDELLNHVYELIRLGKGDLGRLEHIKNTLENKRTMYASDRQYVEGLIQKHLLSTNENQPDLTNPSKIPTNNVSEMAYCWKCGSALQTDQNFCPKCGASKTTSAERITTRVESEKNHSGIRSYQVLSIIGGVLGLITILAYLALYNIVDVIGSSFGSGIEESSKQYVSAAAPLAILIYISCFIVPFIVKKTKTVGIYLTVSSFVVLIATSYVGIIGFALILPAGILALRAK